MFSDDRQALEVGIDFLCYALVLWQVKFFCSPDFKEARGCFPSGVENQFLWETGFSHQIGKFIQGEPIKIPSACIL